MRLCDWVVLSATLQNGAILSKFVYLIETHSRRNVMYTIEKHFERNTQMLKFVSSNGNVCYLCVVNLTAYFICMLNCSTVNNTHKSRVAHWNMWSAVLPYKLIIVWCNTEWCAGPLFCDSVDNIEPIS